MRVLILGLSLALEACGQSPDGYEFGEPEFERTEQPIKVVEYASIAALRAAAPVQTEQSDRDLYAFAYIWPDRCEIHVAPVRDSDARMWLGHEMTHCVFGRWHS